jgi:BASS family bile acid:Na+ symporter
MLQAINRRLDRTMPFLTPISLVLGIILAVWLQPYGFLSIWLFAFMTWVGALGSKFDDFYRIIRHPLPIIVTLLILHLVMPLLALGTGRLLYGEETETVTGLVLGMVIPTGVTSLFWVGVSGGSVAYSLALIMVDTLLAPLVIPGSMAILIGDSIHMNIGQMMISLLFMIVLPTLGGILTNRWSQGKAEQVWKPWLAPFSKLALSLVVALNGAYVAPYFADFDLKLAGILGSCVFLTLVAYALAWLSAKWLRCKDDIAVAMTFTIGMRNISAGAVLAVTFFPAATAVPVIICMLVQQLLASQVNHVLFKRLKANKNIENGNHLSV